MERTAIREKAARAWCGPRGTCTGKTEDSRGKQQREPQRGAEAGTVRRKTWAGGSVVSEEPYFASASAAALAAALAALTSCM